MKRKVVKHGSATLTVSLPAKWAKKFNIKAGDELEITEEKNNLLISTGKEAKSVHEVCIDIDQYGDVLAARAIASLFKAGCDNINVHYNKLDGVSIIERYLNEFIGFEVMKQKENSFLLKEISTFSNIDELDNVLKRAFLLLISMANDCADSIKSNNKELLKKIIHRDTTINKFANYCRRLINKQGIAKIKDVPMVYYIVEEIENLGDEYKYMSKFLLQPNTKIDNPKLIDLLKDANKLIYNFFSLYFKFSSEKAKKLAEDRNIIAEKINKAFKTNCVDEIRFLDYLNRMSLIITNMLGPLMAMKLPGIHKINF
jgi:phosphate uptake regulator